jgi:hypothetical protein
MAVTLATTSRVLSSGVSGSSPVALILAIGIGGTGFLIVLARRRTRIAGWSGGLLLLALVVCVQLTGCAGHAPVVNPNGTPAGTYVYTITATSGSVSHAETVMLVVQ